jgi:hypothetical protein
MAHLGVMQFNRIESLYVSLPPSGRLRRSTFDKLTFLPFGIAPVGPRSRFTWNADEMTTNILIAALQAAHPELTFEITEKAETAYVDDAEYADRLIGLLVDDMLIIDPFASSCGRFDVDPHVSYGLPLAAAKEVVKHNKAPAPTNLTPAP